MGEAYFRLLAKEAGFVANSSSDDKAGWDFEVEPPSPAELDFANQSRPVFRIQVKATAGTKQAVSMAFREALGNKAVKRSLHPDLFQMDVLVAD
jgi:hypothetical protein